MKIKADMHIVVADDFSAMRKLIGIALKEIGLTNITYAKTGLEAVAALEKRGADLVISDWNMPAMTGLELLKWLKNDDRFHQVPFLMVTSIDQRANVIEAVKNGVNGYIIKPFTAQDLEAKIASIFRELSTVS